MCVTSGICRVPFWKFITIDFSGALISVPVLIWLGWWGSNHIESVLHKTMSIERIVGGIAAIIILIWIGFAVFKYYRKRKHLEQRGGQSAHDDRSNPSL
jgi:membrane protein DedA with SNARE-associated domain